MNKPFSKPYTARTGKDIRRLLNEKSKPVPSTGFTDFSGATELALATIWQGLLGHENFGRNNDFFEIGGNSLKAVQMVSRIAAQFGVSIKLVDIFYKKTIADVAGHITGLDKNVPYATIGRQPRSGLLPLSFSQERLWFIHQLQGSVQYHTPAVLRLQGHLNIEALNNALKTVVNRHEVLRTVIAVQDGLPYQHINPVDKWKLQVTQWPADSADLSVADHIQNSISTPFDLSKDEMLRAELILLDEASSMLVVTIHHIASDGWSMSIFVNEVVALYKATIENRVAQLPALKIQYADYAWWQKKLLTDNLFEEKLAYWKAKLEGAATLQLPADFSRPPEPTLRGGIIEFTIPSGLSVSLQAVCQQQGTTLFMLLLAAFKVLLHRYSGQQDIVVGTPVANRSQEEIENLIGFFVNTIALRSQVEEDHSFTEMLQQIKTTALEAYQHQDVPFEKVVDAVVKERDVSRTPLVQVMLIVQNTPDIPSLHLGDVQITTEPVPNTSSKFDFSLSVTEAAGGMACTIEYSTDLYRPETIIRMAGHFTQLLTSVTENPEEKVGKLRMLTQDEQQELLQKNHATHSAYPADKSIVDLFEQQATLTPDAIAIEAGERSITYRQLNERANHLAHHLRTHGVQQETLVPVCMERSLELIVAILAVLKAGAAYVPINPGYPAERISFMLADTKAGVVICNKNTKQELPATAEIITIDIDDYQLFAQSGNTTNPQASILPQHLGYVMYTSGSTGTPKGVLVQHGNVVSLVKGSSYVNLTTDSILLSTGSVSFDATTFEYWGMLLNGGRLIICADDVLLDSQLLKKEIADRKVNIMWFTASWLNQLVDTDISVFEGLDTILAGGEKLSEKHIGLLRGTYPAIQIINGYGPTENTTFSLTHLIEEVSLNMPIPIGRPLNNRTAWVLDKYAQLLPVGIPGEIYLGGAGLSRGYLNQPALTAEKFISHPYSNTAGTRLYKTGDIGRWLANGNMEYLGRIDEQVKINGFRIELGEIEAVLQQCALVETAVVTAKQDEQGSKRLVGYIVPNGPFEKDGIIAHLKSKLPAYMQLALWVEVAAMPLTPNGKINRRALPEPDGSDVTTNEYVAPQNETEHALAEIWQQLLGAKRIGIHDNFFELGGHSLLVMRLMFAIRSNLTIDISIRELFLHPTIAALSTHIQHSGKHRVLPGIQVQQRPANIPLSYGQERLWFIDRLEGSIQYHVPIVLRIKGIVNEAALSNALHSIIERHEILRTVFKEEQGQVYQYILDAANWKLQTTDGTAFSTNEAALQQHIWQFVNTPFDLSKDVMLRAEWLTLSHQESMLVLVLHHIAADAWSMPVIIREFAALYSAYLQQRLVQLNPLPVQYADYAIWQRNHLSGAALDNKLDYWKEKLNGVAPLSLPTDHDRPAIQSAKGATVAFRVDNEQTLQLQEISRQQGTTLFMTLLAAFKVLLHQYSRQQDICVGTPIANRTHPELENLIGFFLNTLAIRSELDSNTSFTGLLQQIKATTLEAFEHQHVPFEKVVEAVVKERDLSRNPLFQVMFVLLNKPYASLAKIEEAAFNLEPYQQNISRFDLTLFVEETGNGLTGTLEYNTDLYIGATIAKLTGHFTELLHSIIRQPQQKVGALNILGAAEKLQLLEEFNDTKTTYPKDKTIIRLFEEQVVRTPVATAVVFDNASLTYQQLNESANQLAHYLQEMGVTSGSLVPVCIERSLEMIISVVAVLKAGGVYVPVDPEYPAERINYMLEDTHAAIVISSRDSRLKLPTLAGRRIVEINGVDQQAITGQPQSNLSVKVADNHLAYVIYTSGSTGKPKGVQMGGSGLVNLLHWQEKQFTNKHRRVLQFASLNFDVSFQEIFSTLCFGSSLYLITNDDRRDMAELFKHISKHQLTHLFIPYIVLKNLVEYALPLSGEASSLEEIMVAGEQLKLTEDIQAFIQQTGVQIINQYGPTEAHVVSSYSINNSEALPALPPIGKPIDNTQLYILGDAGQPVPTGVYGELFIGGVQVADGYLNQPDLTREKFLNNPFSKDGGRLYKTGDLARWLPDGNIEYLGRMDDQVKIRGYRIELGEIENALQGCALVRQAVVLAKPDSTGSKLLVAYIVPEGGFDKPEIISYLKDLLPEYMVPSFLIEMDKLPVTANGKIDRKVLPAPDISTLTVNAYVAPRTATEVQLAEIWKELLGVERIGVEDNFFELGGHSLMAMRVISAIRSQLQVEVAIKDLFLHPTIAALAAHLGIQEKTDIIPAIEVANPRPQHIPLSFSQERLWFIDKLEGSPQYHLPAILQLKGKLDKEAFVKALQHIIERHESLRTVIREDQGKSYQYIQDSKNWNLHFADGSVYNNQGTLQQHIAQLIKSPFNLSSDYMFRAHLLVLGEDDYTLVVTMHHIAADGWSLSIIVRELIEIYDAFVLQRPVALSPLPVQYADYAIWQRRYLQGEILTSKLTYWSNKLQGVATLQLPTDYQRPATQSTRGATVSFTINQQLTQHLVALSHQQGTTLFMTLLAAFNILLQRYSQQNDICIGTPVAGRDRRELEPLIGLFINTLALRSNLNNNPLFTELLQQVKTTTLEAYAHQQVPFEKVVEAVGNERDRSRNPLFQVLLSMQNTPPIPQLRLGELVLTAEPHEHTTSQLDIICNITQTTEGLQGLVEYCTDLFKKETIEKMMAHFEQLLQAIVQSPQQHIGSFSMLNPEEEQLLQTFSITETANYQPATILPLFEAQAAKTPRYTAVIYKEEQLTYGQLNEDANRLARYLQARGIKESQLVPVCLEAGPALLVAILALFKAGAVYVPIDPHYPQERISYLLEDTAATTVITSSRQEEQLANTWDGHLLLIDSDWDMINMQPKENLHTKPAPNQIAYIIYTSGSTGRPKGVMIEHGSLYNYLVNSKTNYLNEADEVTSKGAGSYVHLSPTFDASMTALLMPLLAGKSVVISSGHSINAFEDSNLHKYAPYDFIKLTPAHLPLLQSKMRTGNGSLLTHKLVIGGEALLQSHVQYFTEENLDVTIINEYGPTEATVGCSIYSFHTLTDKESISKYSSISIGKPIDHAELYILGEDNARLPLGVTGELCIGGAGLAKGYLNQPQLTAAKFIPHSFSKEPGARLYKTGDLARWLNDGNLEYLGRKDEQVKIKGYRVELGEIESVLQESPLVKQAVVVVKETGEGNKQLVAYIVATEDDEYDLEQVQAYAKAKLPEYMVPVKWMEIESIPLTTNGKIDRKNLPDPDATAPVSNKYIAPRNELEEVLAGIWQELLDIEQVGIHDNFFELGGDSIIIIQMVSRARRVGYELQVADIFAHQSIAGLSAALSQQAGSEAAINSANEQGMLDGECGLLPIQQWYFEESGEAALSHYNQSVLLGINKTVTAADLRYVLEQLTAHHDALRFVYSKQETGNWQQQYGTDKGFFAAEDLRNSTQAAAGEQLKKRADYHQQTLDIEKGELVRMIWFQMPEAEKQNRLLFIIHHLAVDGVSWRILLDDMEMLLNGIRNGEQVKLGKKSSSYRQWYNTLQQYGQTNQLLSQVKYWEKVVGHYEPLVTDTKYDAAITHKDTAVQKVSLSAAHTSALLQQVPKAYHTEVNDILLCALAMTLCNWQNIDSIVIGMEGHGREQIGKDVDINQTVGWFTSHYPVQLQVGNAKNAGVIIKEIKEQLRSVPGKGLGYGVLKYINKHENIARKKSWDVSFNYFGQLDNVINNSRWFTATNEFDTAGISDEHIISELLSVNGLVQAGQLELIWRYSKLHFSADAINQLTQQYQSNLELLITHCTERENAAPVFTPSDYGLGHEITNDELDDFLNEPYQNSIRRDWMESLYRLTGLQQGMLFHGVYDNRAGAYTEQLRCEIKSPDLAAFKNSWNAVISKHSILRSGFYHDVFSIPVQCVYHKVEMPFALLDYRNNSPEEQVELLKEYDVADLAKGFDFKSVPLMRIALIRLSDEVYRMLWTSHHLLYDGWSLPVLMEEFLTTYDVLAAGKIPVQAEVDKYEDYIRYLERYDKEAANEYWSGYLNAAQPTLLPFISPTSERTKGVGLYQSEHLKLGAEKTAAIEHFLQQNHITLNTLMQGVWAWLLHNYTASNDVVYGVTVSGRPDDLSNVERRVGMYINTLPFRSVITEQKNIISWLQGLQIDQVSSRTYQYSSLPDIQAITGLKGELFDSLLIVENYPVNKVVAARKWNLEIENLVFTEQTNYPLTLIISNVEEIHIDFSYNAELLKNDVVHLIRNHFEQVLLQIIKNGEAHPDDIELITPAEKEQLLVTFNGPSATYPAHQTIIDLVETQAAKTPDAMAVIMDDEQLTYQQLNEQANQLAYHLQQAGVVNNTLVPICTERSVKMIVGMLGILKAGGVYVPIDPQYPADRIVFTLEDTAAEIIVSSKQSRTKLPEGAGFTVVSLDEDWPLISNQPAHNPGVATDAADLAYVIYTSGSTGKPKGVMIQHQNVYAFISWCQQEFAHSHFEIVYAVTSICFDLSVFEIFYPLSVGKPLRLLENGLQINKYVAGDSLVLTNSVPGVIQSLLTDGTDLTNISVINMAGEPVPVSVRQGLDTHRIEVRNLYGPSEDTTYTTMSRVKKDEEITIGKPINNTSIYILNERQQLVPVGVIGEICIAGAGVAKGYLNRPELTAEKFVENPFSADAAAKMYRTGDWGRWLPDGNIAYLGRMDGQVKIRGYRIELGEIESVLQQSGLVESGVVLAKENREGSKQLAGYVVAKTIFEKEAVIAYLRSRLPEYMVPQLWVQMAALPLTPNGKVDRKALPDLEEEQLAGATYQEPRNELETQLVHIWKEILLVDKIGIHDNFFELGGHSLMVMRLLSAIKKELKIDIPVRALFELTTIEQLANYIQVSQQKQQIVQEDYETIEL